MNPLFGQPQPTVRVLVDAREAARMLSISPRKLWSLTKAGAVPSMKVGRVVRYRIDDLDAWTKRMTQTDTSGGVRNGEHSQAGNRTA